VSSTSGVVFSSATCLTRGWRVLAAAVALFFVLGFEVVVCVWTLSSWCVSMTVFSSESSGRCTEMDLIGLCSARPGNLLPIESSGSFGGVFDIAKHYVGSGRPGYRQ